MYLYKVVKELLPELISNEFINGKFNGSRHYWNKVDGITVDLTIDQFGNYESGVINEKILFNYTMNSINVFDDEDLVHMTDEFIYLIIQKISKSNEYQEYVKI